MPLNTRNFFIHLYEEILILCDQANTKKEEGTNGFDIIEVPLALLYQIDYSLHSLDPFLLIRVKEIVSFASDV